MPKKRQRGYFGSTEPGARKILEQIEERRARGKEEKKPDPYDNRISSEKQQQDTEEGLEQLRKLREGQRRRREALEKQRKRQAEEKNKAK